MVWDYCVLPSCLFDENFSPSFLFCFIYSATFHPSVASYWSLSFFWSPVPPLVTGPRQVSTLISTIRVLKCNIDIFLFPRTLQPLYRPYHHHSHLSVSIGSRFIKIRNPSSLHRDHVLLQFFCPSYLCSFCCQRTNVPTLHCYRR